LKYHTFVVVDKGAFYSRLKGAIFAQFRPLRSVEGSAFHCILSGGLRQTRLKNKSEQQIISPASELRH